MCRLLVLVAIAMIAVARGNVSAEEPIDRLKNRVPTSLEFDDALAQARSLAHEILNLSPKDLLKLVSGSAFTRYKRGATYSSTPFFAYQSETNGIYTYVWGRPSEEAFEAEGVVVEFHSGGLWYQIGSQFQFSYDTATDEVSILSPISRSPSVYWYDPISRRGGEFGPKHKANDKQYVPLGIRIAREFRLVHSEREKRAQ